jgi:sortase (surface protein transpeptidase)
LLPLGFLASGAPEVPPLTAHAPAGWLTPLVTPGEVGPAVIIGHVDSARDGPGVFFRLGDLRPGDRLSVTRADRRTVVFRVTSSVLVAKDRFPSDAVYGPVPYPALRLVTCGGPFDAARGHYRDNLVVFAVAST